LKLSHNHVDFVESPSHGRQNLVDGQPIRKAFLPVVLDPGDAFLLDCGEENPILDDGARSFVAAVYTKDKRHRR
jgi:hypothetical protein